MNYSQTLGSETNDTMVDQGSAAPERIDLATGEPSLRSQTDDGETKGYDENFCYGICEFLYANECVQGDAPASV